MYQPTLNGKWNQGRLRTQNPYRMLALSFLATMTLGTVLLMLPQASATGEMTSLTDAAFTAVSCVSVTGLATIDPYSHWSMFGKVVMLLLIQLGGFGIMTFTTLVAIVFGRRIGLRGRLLLQEDLGQDGLKGLLRIVKRVAILTLLVELVGSLVYAWTLYPYLGHEAFYYGVFQAVSTFCNAGFVFFDNNLPLALVGNWGYTLNACILITIGGFGYMAIFDILSHGRRGFEALSLHTKVMLVGSLALAIGSFLLILGLEWSNPGTLGPLPISEKVSGALFAAVTARTAGLATIDYGQLHSNTAFLNIVLMFIGAGPNSTGGGVKVSTIVVLFLAAFSLFKSRHEVEVFERRIPIFTIVRAIGIVFFSMVTIVIGTFIVSWVEPFSFLDVLFEVTSAFGTVGLSRGITPDLSTVSKWVLILIMFTGRIGALALVGTFALRQEPSRPISYPEANVML